MSIHELSYLRIRIADLRTEWIKKSKRFLHPLSCHEHSPRTALCPGLEDREPGECDGPIFLVYLGYCLWEIAGFPV
jgi:hypothetical protein